ncbi:MAG TPA: hypothetical protein VFD90_05300 [Gaiellales bacterium]|jgi:hypothetical protein|nr:hypothetical protein [Gaiellales bacterium]
MRPELIALLVPVALLLRVLTRRRPPVRADSAEALRWWGLARGLSDCRRRSPDVPVTPEPGFDPLDVALGMQAHGSADDAGSERLSAAIPSHAITLQGSALFHTGDRQRVHAAVEGKLDDTLRGTVLLMTCERRDEHDSDWHWVCDLTVVAMEGVTPRGPGLLMRRRSSGGGAGVELPEDYVPLTLESAELDELYDVRIAAGCSEVEARSALTPAMIAWLCDRGPEALVVETGGASVRLATPALLSSDAELEAFTADACWLAHAFIADVPAEAQAA